MYLGEVVELGPVDKVWDAPAHPYTRALLAAMPSSDPDQSHRDAADLGRSAQSDRSAVRLPVSHPLSVCGAALRKCDAKTHATLDTMGHQAACYMAIPGSGHSRAPANKSKGATAA